MSAPTSKHLLWPELEMLAASRDLVVICQHFYRSDGGIVAHFKWRLGDLEARLPHLKLFAILGPGVGFFVGAREAEHHDMRAAAFGLGSDWPGDITVLHE